MKRPLILQLPVKTADITTESGITWKLEYHLQKNEDGNGRESFNIRVDKVAPDGDLDDTAQTNVATDDYDEVLTVIMYLAEGTVPPSVLEDMVEELLPDKAA